MERLDKKIFELGLVDTRNKAQLLIEEGVVFVDGVKVTKPAYKTNSTNIEIRKENIFVGRGAHKIEGALSDFNIDVTNYIVADVGASTGGFTEFVLLKGADYVFAIDVGHDQLAKKLREDARVENLEGHNIRDIEKLTKECDLAVVDLSFISIKLVLKNILSILAANGKAIVLIKPQFEVGRDNLNKQGICKNLEVVENMLNEILNFSNENKFYISDCKKCAISGRDGNQEYFFLYDKSLLSSKISSSEIKLMMES